MTDRTAGCACNSLTLAVSGEPEIVALCSCRQCQLRTGAPYSVHAFFAESAVAIKGESKAYTRDSDSGRTVTFHFCPECGSSVFWKAEGRPGALGIAFGAFSSGAELPPPVAAVWVGEKAGWVPLPEGMPRFEQGATPPPPANS